TAMSLVAAAICLAGCKASEAPSSAFIESPELMTKDATLPFQRTYWNKKYDQQTYTEVMIAPVNTTYALAASFWEKGNAVQVSPEQLKKDVQALADYTQESFTKAFADDPKHRLTVVKAAGPRTLI